MIVDINSSRRRILDLARRYMISQMGCPPDEVEARIEEAAATTSWIEFAHTPQLPHLGVVRTMLLAGQHADNRSGILVLFLNDQLPPRDLLEARQLPLIRNNAIVSNPPTFAEPGQFRKYGMNRLRAPTSTIISSFERRWIEIEPERESNIVKITTELKLFAGGASSYGGFLARVMIDLLDCRCLVVPASELAPAFPEALPKLRATRRLWCHCQNCGYRISRSPTTIEICQVCDSHQTFFEAPDVIARQFLANLTNLDLRICGRTKTYQTEADVFSNGLKVSPPSRIRVSGNVRIRDPKSGHPLERINLLQILGWGGLALDLRCTVPGAPDENAVLSINKHNRIEAAFVSSFADTQ